MGKSGCCALDSGLAHSTSLLSLSSAVWGHGAEVEGFAMRLQRITVIDHVQSKARARLLRPGFLLCVCHQNQLCEPPTGCDSRNFPTTARFLGERRGEKTRASNWKLAPEACTAAAGGPEGASDDVGATLARLATAGSTAGPSCLRARG